MRRGRIITGTITIFASVLFAAPALGATPTQIAQDLRDGQLNGTYSQADLRVYLQSAIAQGYGNPVSTPAATGSGVAGVSTPAATGSGVAGVATPVVTRAPRASAAGVAKTASPKTGVAGVQTTDRPLAATAQVGTLPFTGLDLALLTIGGALLLMLGLGARRAGRARA